MRRIKNILSEFCVRVEGIHHFVKSINFSQKIKELKHVKNHNKVAIGGHPNTKMQWFCRQHIGRNLFVFLLKEALTLSYLGGSAKRHHFSTLVVTPKRLHLFFWSFLTFPKFKETKFWSKFEFQFFTLTPLGGGY